MPGIDLDAARKRRLAAAAASAKAAKAEYTVGEEPIVLGGERVAVLPAELPLEVWQPLVGIPYLPLLLRKLVEAAQSKGEQQAEAMRPGGGRARLGADPARRPDRRSGEMGHAAARAGRLPAADGRASQPLGHHRAGAVRLGQVPAGRCGPGELMAPSETPSTGGTTSKRTSSASTTSTPERSGSAPASAGSSAPMRLLTLMRGLPADALLRRDSSEIGADRWGLTEELLAQVVEITSVIAAERRLKQPVELPRPGQLRARTDPAGAGGMGRAVGVLRASTREVRGGGR